ncbi:MAG TPA: NCS2 family permease [Vicinamibacterales bacterium]|nr:NCS2 family permease [Vicinamibacterales bacterium]
MQFDLQARGTTAAREVRGGITTFLTMAYILFANPSILAGAGVPFEACAAATAAAAAICTLLMGLGTNFPVALAPGMGLNAVVAFQVAGQTGSWQAAMGLVALNGLVVLALVVAGVREAVMRAIPLDLRRAISVGIGLFIAFIGAVNARLVVIPPSSVDALKTGPSAIVPPVTHGSLQAAEPLLALAGLLIIAFLLSRRVAGAIVIGIAVATLAALVLGISHWPTGTWLRVPQFDTVFQADLRRAFDIRLLPLLLSLIMVDFFDTIGTVTAVAETGGLHDREGHIPRLRSILAVDSISAVIGGTFGVSSVTSYVESAAGVAEGARTGLHNVVVAVLFAGCIFAAPLVAIVPAAASAPALIVVGFLMCQQIVRMDFGALDTAIPAFLILLMTPLTFSISHGIGYGFIAYVAIKLLRGRPRDVQPIMYAVAALFVAYFWIG